MINNVWKIGTRWSKKGNPSTSVLSLMRRNNIAFVWLEENKKSIFLNYVKDNDYIALSDGYQIVAIGKVIGIPNELRRFPNFIITDKDRTIIDIEDSHVVGVRINIVDILESDLKYFKYQSMGRFFQIYKGADDIKKYYENHFNVFDIKSDTQNIRSLFNEKSSYVIPVYQRPYEWTSAQVVPFIKDILGNFFEKEDANMHLEPIFIGTMQLSKRKFISSNEYQHDVIDGQQRITTLTIFIKELLKKYPNELQTFKKINWISTHVSNTQNRYLQDYLSDNKSDDTTNPYWKNAQIINDTFDEYLRDRENKSLPFNFSSFITYILDKVLFVVIETSAGLSKTIKIFNTINNAGLDLNGNDLFKIRMYEYLRDIKNKGEEEFDEIQKLYSLVDENNKKYGKAFSMGTMLNIYKNILITEYDLPTVLYGLSWETFYERLFDSLLSLNNNWEHFKKLNGLELKIETLEHIIELRYSEENHLYSLESSFADKMIKHFSRYGRLRNLVVYTFLFYHKNDFNGLERVLITLNKYFFINSLHYSKQVNKVITDTYKLVKSMKDESIEPIESIEYIINNVHEEELKREISKNLLEGSKWWRYLVCGVSTFLIERENGLTKENLQDKLFDTSNFDIEHIHANNDSSINIPKELQNSIGNLTHLEFSINRKIKDKEFADKKLQYKGSNYKIITEISKLDKWGIEEIESRRQVETERIYNYIKG